MSDKLQADFNLYYKELENFTGHFKNGSQQIETDKTLSRVGKHEKAELLKQEHLESVNDLAERFSAEFDKRVSNIGRTVRGEKNDPVLDSIKRRFSKGDDISSDESSRLLLSEMRETKDIMRKSNFQNMLSTADIEQVKKTAQTLNDSKDVERLGWLRESVSLRGEKSLANSLTGQIEGLRDSQMSDEQRNLQTISEKIEREMKLFQYSLERSKKGDFVDVRTKDEVK